MTNAAGSQRPFNVPIYRISTFADDHDIFLFKILSVLTLTKLKTYNYTNVFRFNTLLCLPVGLLL